MPRAGALFREALAQESPLQIVGAPNAHAALLAQRAGYRALYVSGGGVAAGSLGMPDLGINTLQDVLVDVQRITDVCELPVLVDIDTGFGPSAFNIARTVKSLVKAGAGACHLEDQLGAKRCGHRPGKAVVTTGEMVDRIKAAVDARGDDAFFLVARTDAIQCEGTDAALARAQAYAEAGADAVFVEAATDLATYRRFARALPVPILANMTEFGVTPLFSATDLAQHGVAMVLYPLSAFRAMAQAADEVYRAIRRDGHQQAVVDRMQTRAQLYEVIGYHAYEDRLDRLYAAKQEPAA